MTGRTFNPGDRVEVEWGRSLVFSTSTGEDEFKPVYYRGTVVECQHGHVRVLMDGYDLSPMMVRESRVRHLDILEKLSEL